MLKYGSCATSGTAGGRIGGRAWDHATRLNAPSAAARWKVLIELFIAPLPRGRGPGRGRVDPPPRDRGGRGRVYPRRSRDRKEAVHIRDSAGAATHMLETSGFSGSITSHMHAERK